MVISDNFAKTRLKIMGWLGMILATGGLTAFTMALTMFIRNFTFYRYSAITTGKIVKTEFVDNGRRRYGYAALIEFTPPIEKKKSIQPVRFKGNELKPEKEHKIGAEISVRYIPQKPEAAMINSFREIWSEPLVGNVVGLVFTIVGLFFLS